jgi:ABC-type uncharacterized transport system involved in gliding motility auxiliary subunit
MEAVAMQGKRTNLTIVILTKIYRHGLSPVIFAIALFFGLVAFNYVVAVKSPDLDLTKNHVNSLSDETLKLLGQIDSNVTIRAFYLGSSQRTISQLLNKYSQKSSRIKVEFIDPLKNPVVAEKYDVSLPGTLVLEMGGKKTTVKPDEAGRSHGEREVTTALYRLITETAKKIYFTTGHGELSVSDVKPRGLSTVLDRLEEQNYLVETINLLEKKKIPEDCNLLVVAGPTVKFSDEEVNMVTEYALSGRSVLFLLGPGKLTGLEPLVEEFGILPGNDYIYETSRNMTIQAGGAIAPLVAPRDSSEITEKLSNQNFLFPFVRSMSPRFKSWDSSFRRLLASSENSWAETDLQSAMTVNTGIKPSRSEQELKGPVDVAITVEREYPLPDSIATPTNKSYSVRSAFFGNVTFCTNEVTAMFPANLSLFTNTVNWITKNENIIEITPHTMAFTPVELRDSDRRVISWLSVVLIPLAILMAGIVVWYRRR